ncbi:LysR family transcriptional regulator [Kordiimonas marina]|uniref:LysR family transcriptional regulator n=1 Tax=Kordiimonas marina TaxID=2872312 RepID=UPI001FF6AC24|nr:LysR family transcriptional regulator [Kordiimonas marina]MCJ9428676.1 LysR family transcriptional regulator [Kordiimonas marina]
MDDHDLRDLTAFAAVARHKSFRRAAAELRVSVSGLSQRMKALEERLGLRLLNRTTRSVAPTEAGERLLARLTPALRDVEDALADIHERQEAVTGRLRINAPPPAAHLVLAPMIGPFLARHPGIQLEIITDSLFVDIVAEGYDAGVRWEESLAGDMIALSLGPTERYALTASPAFLAAHGIPKVPEDLLGKPMLGIRFKNHVQHAWEFEKDGRTVHIRTEGPFVSNDMRLLIGAALDGIGFVGSFEGYARPYIESGELVELLPDWAVSFPGPFLYYPSRRQPPAPLAAFIAFVRDWRRGVGKEGE